MLPLLLALACAPPEAPGPIQWEPPADPYLEIIEGAPEIPWLADGAPPVEAPRIPWLAEGHPPLPAWSCPVGWRSVPGPDGEAPCDPWPVEGRVECLLDHEAHFPGEPGCRAVGAACADDGWPSSVPEGALYVAPGGTGDGSSRDAPIALAGALQSAAAGATLALSAGTYDGGFVVDRAVTLLGACPAETVLTRSAAVVGDAVVTVTSPGGAIRDLTVADTEATAIVVASGAALDAAGLAIARVGAPAARVEPGALDASFSDIVWSDTITWVDEDTPFALVADAPTTVSRAAFVRAGRAAWFGATAPSQAYEVSDVVVVDGDGPVFFSGTGVVARLAVDESGPDALRVDGGAVTAEDLWVRGGWDSPWYDDGAIDLACVNDGVLAGVPSLTISRMWLTEVRNTGVSVWGDWPACAAELVVQDAVISGDELGSTLRGASIWFADAALDRVLVTDMHTGIEVFASDADVTEVTVVRSLAEGIRAHASPGLDWIYDATLTLEDVAILGPTEGPEGWFVVGLYVDDTATAVERVLIDTTDGFGAFLYGSSATDTTITDLLVRGQPLYDEYGVVLTTRREWSHRFALSRVAIEDVDAVGLSVGGEFANVDATDLAVRRVGSDAEGEGGVGVSVSGGALSLERAEISDARVAGVAASESAFATLRDVAVLRVLPPRCVEDETCEGPTTADGVSVTSADLVADWLLVDGAERVSLYCSIGSVDVADAVLRDGDIGVVADCGGRLERVAVEPEDGEAEE